MADVRRFLVAQTNRYSAALRKLLSVKGEAHDISWGVHLEDERPEFSFVKGERLWTQYNEVTSAAGSLSYVAIQNPSNSGIIAVITNAHATVTTAPATIRLNLLIPVQAGLGGPMQFRDTRWSPSGLGSTTLCRAATVAAYGATAIIDQHVVGTADNEVDVIGPCVVPQIILAPGTECAISVSAVGVNTLKVNFCGYERPHESGELIPG